MAVGVDEAGQHGAAGEVDPRSAAGAVAAGPIQAIAAVLATIGGVGADPEPVGACCRRR